jgi:hypothetical protein
MRDSIEERVLRVLAQKRALFEELFAGTSDEVALDAMGQQAFLEAMRELFGPAAAPVAEAPVAAEAPATPAPREAAAEVPGALVQAGVQFLEALAAALGGARRVDDPQTGQPAVLVPLPSAQLVQRGAAALRAIVQALDGQGGQP